ncbi:MarR family transcriptional regulator [Altererythrobacter indicus]|uniref:MarR family transcriptional regulator n=1 Tax=Altericroceibacterium indicum TaxID=374177 RepID=A0A845AAR4_9SPHN|nr:MarR family transcriptional regulator [Altericroceibacterium indicum]MXP26343.1 MarR family transcriptional regulator [Altericroceibacterium indicum]
MKENKDNSKVSRLPKVQDENVDFGMMATLTGFSVKMVWILGYSLLSQKMPDPAITPQRVTMLELIGCNPGLAQTQLAHALGLSRPATSLAIDFWQARGVVERRVDQDDRRAFGIHLTKQGQCIWADLRAKVKQSDEILTKRLSEEEIEQLNRLLSKIYS